MSNRAGHHWTIPRHADQQGVIEELLRDLESPQFSGDRIADIRTAVIEACLNASENSTGLNDPIELRSVWEGDSFVVEVENRGKIFTLPETKPDIREKVEGREHPRGWGLYLMRTLCDEIVVRRVENRNIVSMRFTQPKAKGENERD